MKKEREYVIYMTPVSTEYCFMDFEYAMKHNWNLNAYVPVWRGTIESETINGALEELFRIFNVDRPAQYCGRSLSMSDVVLLDKKPYYCDRFGWSECPNRK